MRQIRDYGKLSSIVEDRQLFRTPTNLESYPMLDFCYLSLLSQGPEN